MRRIVAAILVWAATPAWAGPPAQLIGITTATFKGDVGLFTLHDACFDEFPRERRVRTCTVVEAKNTLDPPAISTPAWLTDDADVFTECAGWAVATSTRTAPTVTSDGMFGRLTCSVARPVACCALPPPPVSVPAAPAP